MSGMWQRLSSRSWMKIKGWMSWQMNGASCLWRLSEWHVKWNTLENCFYIVCAEAFYDEVFFQINWNLIWHLFFCPSKSVESIYLKWQSYLTVVDGVFIDTDTPGIDKLFELFLKNLDSWLSWLLLWRCGGRQKHVAGSSRTAHCAKTMANIRGNCSKEPIWQCDGTSFTAKRFHSAQNLLLAPLSCSQNWL